MILSTDSTANLPIEYYKNLNISMIPMQINLDSKTYDDLSADLPCEKFYQLMKEGKTPTTAQINEYRATEYFEELLKKGEDILHLAFSSGLSGTVEATKRVADELNKTHKNKIVVVDTLSAAGEQGILVLLAHDLISQGKTIDEVSKEIHDMIPNVCAYFTVEHLKYLVRGGRVSKVAGMLGSVLNIKPIMRVNESGKLVSYKKVISRKKSISALTEICKEKIADTKYLFINHANCLDEANSLADMVENAVGKRPIITDLTQVIGCHTGPGLLALFFVGKNGR